MVVARVACLMGNDLPWAFFDMGGWRVKTNEYDGGLLMVNGLSVVHRILRGSGSS